MSNPCYVLEWVSQDCLRWFAIGGGCFPKGFRIIADLFHQFTCPALDVTGCSFRPIPGIHQMTPELATRFCTCSRSRQPAKSCPNHPTCQKTCNKLFSTSFPVLFVALPSHLISP